MCDPPLPALLLLLLLLTCARTAVCVCEDRGCDEDEEDGTKSGAATAAASSASGLGAHAAVTVSSHEGSREGRRRPSVCALRALVASAVLRCVRELCVRGPCDPRWSAALARVGRSCSVGAGPLPRASAQRRSAWTHMQAPGRSAGQQRTTAGSERTKRDDGGGSSEQRRQHTRSTPHRQGGVQATGATAATKAQAGALVTG